MIEQLSFSHSGLIVLINILQLHCKLTGVLQVGEGGHNISLGVEVVEHRSFICFCLDLFYFFLLSYVICKCLLFIFQVVVNHVLLVVEFGFRMLFSGVGRALV